MKFLLLILLHDIFSESRSARKSLYSQLKKDLDAVENEIQLGHNTLAQALRRQMTEMENTLLMKIEEIKKEAQTKSTSKKEEAIFEDEYTYDENSDESSGYRSECWSHMLACIDPTNTLLSKAILI